jgi:hypothetical protein
MLLLFFNYIEMVFGFAVLYSFTNKFNKPLSHWFDSIYFSTVTSTIGYGDLYPIDPLGKFLVSVQSMIVLMFVVLFLNFFSKVKSKGTLTKTAAFSLNHQSRFSKSSGVSIPIPTCVVSTILIRSQIPGNAVVPVFRCFQ